MKLSKGQQKELAKLEELEKSNIEYFSSSISGLWGIFFNSFRTEYKSKEQRRERLVGLRTLKRLFEEGKNTNEHFQRYYDILKEEKQKFNLK